ncbi:MULTISPECIES: SGNH/GDSL hydrolase family protein [Bacillus]|uniref:SGNH/GDSL hydrolase family protein n=1 Tax=Bacillus infantis TaxID=324767 RepID=A0A5D4SJ67_9BACI|nr:MULTISPECIES: SGNH/GDSL hydrolase family protein [Bacillus]PLR74271.1 hydrolase [Bacillus sp. UMB0728]TYS63329.1 SGNH/GDSL hydrolase family protein [Bacillus infantis]
MKKKVVFIGDSITWSGVSEDDSIGNGYVRLIHDYLTVTCPGQDFEIHNKGVSGDRIIDLAERWERDVIQLNPDILSISIGINDVARQMDSPDIDQMLPDKFESILADLLEEVKKRTNARIILMEPTVIKEDITSVGNLKLKPYIGIIHKTAKSFGAATVPTHQAFISYLEKRKNQPLTIDGVHMNAFGNMLMAKTWLDAVKDILKLNVLIPNESK